MMWNWLVSSLAVGATVVLYDGSPFIPSPNVLWDCVDRFGYAWTQWPHSQTYTLRSGNESADGQWCVQYQTYSYHTARPQV